MVDVDAGRIDARCSWSIHCIRRKSWRNLRPIRNRQQIEKSRHGDARIQRRKKLHLRKGVPQSQILLRDEEESAVPYDRTTEGPSEIVQMEWTARLPRLIRKPIV